MVSIGKADSIADIIDAEIRKLKKRGEKKKAEKKPAEGVKLQPKKQESINDIVKKLSKTKPKSLTEDEKKELDILKDIFTMVKYLDKVEDKDAFIANLYSLSPRGQSTPYAGAMPQSQYADYGKIWGHLGKDTVVRMYDGDFSAGSSSAGTTKQELVSYQTFEKSMKSIKYFTPGGHSSIMLDAFYGNVPMHGVDSKEWEKMKLYMMVDNGVMFKLMMGTGI